MRSYEEYKQIMYLWEQGKNKLNISKTLGIPRRTVRDVINRFGTSEKLHEYIDGAVSAENIEIATLVLSLWEEGKSKTSIRGETGYSKYLIDACIEQFRSLAQLQEHIQYHGTLISIQTYNAGRRHKNGLRKYTNEDLSQAVAESVSIRETLLKLGVKPSGGIMKQSSDGFLS